MKASGPVRRASTKCVHSVRLGIIGVDIGLTTGNSLKTVGDATLMAMVGTSWPYQGISPPSFPEIELRGVSCLWAESLYHCVVLSE